MILSFTFIKYNSRFKLCFYYTCLCSSFCNGDNCILLFTKCWVADGIGIRLLPCILLLYMCIHVHVCSGVFDLILQDTHTHWRIQDLSIGGGGGGLDFVNGEGDGIKSLKVLTVKVNAIFSIFWPYFY